MEIIWYIIAALGAGIGTGLAGLSAATVMVPILIVLCPSFAGETGGYRERMSSAPKGPVCVDPFRSDLEVFNALIQKHRSVLKLHTSSPSPARSRADALPGAFAGKPTTARRPCRLNIQPQLCHLLGDHIQVAGGIVISPPLFIPDFHPVDHSGQHNIFLQSGKFP